MSCDRPAASRALTPFRPVAGVPALHTARRGALRVTAVRLPDGGVAVYNPVGGLNEDAASALDALGPVRALVAASHFHPTAFPEYADAYPEAVAYAAPEAAPRLERQSGLAFAPLDEAAGLLPEAVSLLAVPGTKNGETWLRAQAADGTVAYAVGDAFAGSNQPDGEATASVRGAWRSVCVRDAAVAGPWVLDRLAEDAPTVLLPSHGGLVRSSSLAADLAAALA